MISTAEPHQLAAARVVARQPHRLHHRFRARHVKGDLVQAGDFLQTGDVVGDHRMVAAQDWSQGADAFIACFHARFVEVVTEQIHPVGTRQVVETIPVEVGQRHPLGRRQERARAQMLAHEPAVLERHAVGFGELQVRNAFAGLGGEPTRFGEPLPVQSRQPVEARPAAGRDLVGCVVGAEEPVERHQRGHAPREPRVSGQRAVLRPG